jgi:hypothetical protein
MYIYVLKCPFTGEVRYVGKATNTKARLRQHINEAKTESRNLHKCRWIQKVIRQGGRPIIEVDVELKPGDDWKVVERERIAFYRAQGCRLMNVTEGGDGGGAFPEETLKELSQRASLRFGSPEGRKRQSETMKRLCSDPEWLAERTRSQKAARATPEYKAALSARSKAMWEDPDFRARWSASRAKTLADPDFQQRLSAAVRRAQADPKVRQKIADKARAAWARPDVRERQIKAMRAAAIRDAR